MGIASLIKIILGIGTLYTIIESGRAPQGGQLFTVANAISFFASVFFITDSVFKMLACVTSSRKEGYAFMIWALVLSVISNSFYVFSDQGFLAGLVMLLASGGLCAINYVYISKRKWVYGNPDLL